MIYTILIGLVLTFVSCCKEKLRSIVCTNSTIKKRVVRRGLFDICTMSIDDSYKFLGIFHSIYTTSET